jgi:membrane fusion protein, multidrug efflux system
VVSGRQVSTGDTTTVGRELIKVIDPGSLRFEGLVSAERLQELKLGQVVSFRVNGFGDTVFSGKVRRIDSAANATTRQVAVQVAFADAKTAPRVAGLFAEGRIETGGTQQLMLPEGTVVRSGDNAHAWRLGEGQLQKVEVKLGERDPRSGEFPVLSGLAPGDRVLRNPGGQLVAGQKFEFTKSAAQPASAAAPT